MLDKCQQLTHVELLSHFSRDFTAKKTFNLRGEI